MSAPPHSQEGPPPAKRSRHHQQHQQQQQQQQRKEEAANGGDGGGAGGGTSSVAEAMMRRMGHQEGRGLGKQAQGITEPVKAVTVKGRSGLGFAATSSSRPDFQWREGDDPVVVRRSVDWLTGCGQSELPSAREMADTWLTVDREKLTLDDEAEFVDPEVLKGVLECKTFLDSMTNRELMDSRSRSNPYETVKNAIFMNRAALKMAEMDAVLQFSLSRSFDSEEVLHFADICAGPGGFTEYLLWRNRTSGDHGPRAKGFGLTLKGECDFKLCDMLAGSPECFCPYYGPGCDGDIYSEDNMMGFRDLIMADTASLGVHLVTADGGFSVEGQENIQEIRSKQLYLCQALTAMLVLRDGGSFVCKLFDVFTEFSAGLLYLLHRSFAQFALFKPATSRPANSERYVICRGYDRTGAAPVVQYLLHANAEINRLKALQPAAEKLDVQCLVPLHLLHSDGQFGAYLTRSNDVLGRMQIVGLSKIHHFYDNRGMKDMRQEDARAECLQFWEIPDEPRGKGIERLDPTVRISALLETSKMDEFLPSGRTLTAEGLLQDKDFLPHENKVLVCGGLDGVALLFSRGNGSLMQWTKTSVKWAGVEAKSFPAVSVPRDTMLLVQVVQEFKPPSYQLKETCLHVLDCPVMQGRSLAQLPIGERLSRVRQLSRCVNFVGVSGRARLRPLRLFRAYELLTDAPNSLRNHLALVAVKGSKVPRPMMRQEDGYVFQPTGIFMFRTTRDQWHMTLSKGTGKLYYYHKDGKLPTSFDLQPEFLAGFHEHVACMYWLPWQGTTGGKDLDLKGLQRVLDTRLGRPVPQEYHLTCSQSEPAKP